MRAVIFAGVNGAGKTTFARRLLELEPSPFQFLNADEIKRELGHGASDIEAGRLLITKLNARVQLRQSFALETTLSSTRYARQIQSWQAQGYEVELHYLELASAEAAIDRVATRVAAGGHHIAEADIRRRFARSKQMFENVYKSTVDIWYHYASEDGAERLIDEGSN